MQKKFCQCKKDSKCVAVCLKLIIETWVLWIGWAHPPPKSWPSQYQSYSIVTRFCQQISCFGFPHFNCSFTLIQLWQDTAAKWGWNTTTRAVWPEKNCQMFIKRYPKMISQEEFKILTPLQKLPKNVPNLATLNTCLICNPPFGWFNKISPPISCS